MGFDRSHAEEIFRTNNFDFNKTIDFLTHQEEEVKAPMSK